MAKPRYFRAEVVDDRLELMSLDGPLVVVPVQQAIAAPDLLAALRAARGAHVDAAPDEHDSDMCSVCHLANDAIAKAEGKS